MLDGEDAFETLWVKIYITLFGSLKVSDYIYCNVYPHSTVLFFNVLHFAVVYLNVLYL